MEPGRLSSAHCPALDSAMALWTIRRPGQPPDPQNWQWTSLKGRGSHGGDRRYLGCTSDINHWRRNSFPTPHSPQQVLISHPDVLPVRKVVQ